MYLECVSFSKFYSHRTNLLFVLLEALQEWALTESLRPRTKSSAWWVLSQRPSCPEAEKLEGLRPFSKNLKSYLCKKAINSQMWIVENNIKSEGKKTVKQNLDSFIKCLTDGHLHHYDWQITILWVHCTSLQSALVKPIRHSPHNALAIAPTFCLLTNLAGQLDYHISR